jgi:hypothetical protein
VRSAAVRLAISVSVVAVNLFAVAPGARAQDEPTNQLVVRVVLDVPPAPASVTYSTEVRCLATPLPETTVLDETLTFDYLGQPTYTFPVPTHLSEDPTNSVDCNVGPVVHIPSYFSEQPALFEMEPTERACEVTDPGISDGPPDLFPHALCGAVENAYFPSRVVNGVITLTMTIRVIERPPEASAPPEPVTQAPTFTG